ncbi:MAG: SpoVA/SpoVAEb family sporulation membrane protein [Oscillospiraceae bacterium]|jgi:stage V sporulation protein AE|nr:SpoVA/SpoVAEb family sporulation membrane protein [Oscillospiraceae bacterium]
MNVFVSFLKCFLVGGVFCIIGQILIDKTKLTPARILTGYVVAGVVLGFLGIYKPIADFGQAGASVPLTGFGYTLSEGIKKAVAEKGLLGVFTGGFAACAAGLTAAVAFSLIASFIVKAKEK